MSRPILYGARGLADSKRAVRRNTMLLAEDIPESEFGFQATPATRSVAATLVHIAWLPSFDRWIHEELHLDSGCSLSNRPTSPPGA